MAQARDDWMMGALAAQLPSNCFGASGFAVPRPSVFVLLRMCRPFAIIWRIPSIIVDALKSKTGRLLSHVSKKVLKAVAPAVAYRDAAACVVCKPFIFRIVTPGFHVRPRAKRGAPSAGCVTVGNALLPSGFALEAPARLRVSVPKICCSNRDFSFADTTTAPEHKGDTARAALPMRDTENGEASKRLACDINKIGHGILSTGCCVKWRPSPEQTWSLRLM